MIAQPADPPPAVSARQALETLRRAGAVLTASLAFDATLRRVARLVVPDVADWCAVLIIGEDGSEHEISSEHPDPEVERTLRAIRTRRRGLGGRLGIARRARQRPAGPRHRRDERAGGGPRSARARGARTARPALLHDRAAHGARRTIGAVTLLSTTPGRHYTAQDLAFAETLAGRFALAIDNAQLYEAAGRSRAARHAVRHGAGRAGVHRPRGALRPRQRGARGDERRQPGGPHRPHDAQVLGGEGGPVAEAHRTVVGTGEPVLDREISGRPSASTDEVRHWVSSFTPVRGPSGDLWGSGWW